MEKNNLYWMKCVTICTDGCPWLPGLYKRIYFIRQKQIVKIDAKLCFICQELLVTKTVGLLNYVYLLIYATNWEEPITIFSILISGGCLGNECPVLYMNSRMQCTVFEQKTRTEFIDLLTKCDVQN
ncbi:hypothetical protein PR048_001745 [Dryococelus australis]|uniref:Uncharacterized protein n=1 Tax=Dryococelus australis TaxID=614101 RepID=A0ABQ9IIC1_9NEOP|nr:hypothetical protein PR048_001745 [Dryococelus australis]